MMILIEMINNVNKKYLNKKNKQKNIKMHKKLGQY